MWLQTIRARYAIVLGAIVLCLIVGAREGNAIADGVDVRKDPYAAAIYCVRPKDDFEMTKVLVARVFSEAYQQYSMRIYGALTLNMPLNPAFSFDCQVVPKKELTLTTSIERIEKDAGICLYYGKAVFTRTGSDTAYAGEGIFLIQCDPQQLKTDLPPDVAKKTFQQNKH
jgi:hypothetical protein